MLETIDKKYFHVYKSSAGSGKTYALVKNYIKLALASPDYFRNILAVTFTNKAAEEMKLRIIDYLKAISEGRHSLIQELSIELAITQQEVCENAGQILKQILHDYSRFSVTTIDTFFHRVIRTFAREIGLQGSFQVELDTDHVLDVAIDNMLDQVDADQSLKQWLIRFASDAVTDGRDYDIKKDIKRLAKILFEESFKHLVQVNPKLTRDQIGQIQKHSFSVQQRAQAEIKQKAGAMVSKIEAAGLDLSSFAYGKTGVAGFIYGLASGELKEPGKRATDALESVEAWYSKSSKQKEQIHQLVFDGLQDELRALVDTSQQRIKEIYTAQALSRYLYTFGILQDLQKRIIDYRDAEEVILISDLSDFLRNIVRENEAPYIYEKVGNRYLHFLIDEFQDTSGFQWDNFKPLVENSVAAGQENIVVGDTKQSIYRWRGGDWQILLEKIEQDIGSAMTEVHNLNRNYRSHKQIVAFNNGLFENLPGAVADRLKEELTVLPSDETHSILDRISVAYDSATQLLPENNNKNEGYIHLEFIDDEAKTFKEDAISFAIQQIEKLQDAGFKPSDMAILVRRNREAELLVQALLAKSTENSLYRYDVVSGDALYLNNAPVVRFFINVFQSLLDETDMISIREVSRYYQHEVLNSDVDFRKITLEGDLNAFLPEDFLANRQTLLRMPAYELSEKVIQLFSLASNYDSLPYLQAFQDAILDFSNQEKGDLITFLDWWEERGSKRTLQPGEVDAIQILTIHKAKGLQFPVVLIPFCNWSLDHESSQTNLIWVETNPLGDDQKVFLPVAYNQGLLKTDFSQYYVEERVNALMDNLNLLYVALTRAEQVLICASPNIKQLSLKHAGELLYHHVEKDLTGDRYIFGALPTKASTPDQKAESTSIGQYISQNWKDRVSIKQSHHDMLSGEAEDPLKYGNLIHDILAYMNEAGDLENAISKVAIQRGSHSDEVSVIQRRLEVLLSNEPMRQWYAKGIIAKNEISLVDESGRVKRLDRVIFLEDAIEVVDFKTGIPSQSDKKQVKNYLKLLRQMGYQNLKGSLYYLAEEKVEEVYHD